MLSTSTTVIYRKMYKDFPLNKLVISSFMYCLLFTSTVTPPQLYILQGHRNGVPGGQQVPASQRPRQVQLTALPPRRALVLLPLLAAAATRGKTSWLIRIKQEVNGPIDQRALGQ